jgi:hypothetical protein
MKREPPIKKIDYTSMLKFAHDMGDSIGELYPSPGERFPPSWWCTWFDRHQWHKKFTGKYTHYFHCARGCGAYAIQGKYE